jgi:hypothetical protein
MVLHLFVPKSNLILSIIPDSVTGLSRSDQASPKPPSLPIEERAEKQALTDATLTNDKGILKALFSFKHEERKMETEENDDSLSSKDDLFFFIE